MKVAFFCLFIVVLISCTKESNTTIITNLKNSTNHQIRVLPYKNGIVYASDTIKLSPNETFEFGYGNMRGLVTVPIFSTNMFGSGLFDSNVVVFDNVYKMTHYLNTPTQLAEKYYLFDSNRSTNNAANYQFETEKINKHNQKNTLTFTFIEQDYLDAAR